MSSNVNAAKGGFLIDFVERMESEDGLKLTCALACPGGGKNYATHSKRMRLILGDMRKSASAPAGQESALGELLDRAETLVDDSEKWAGEYEGVCLFVTPDKTELTQLPEKPVESSRIGGDLSYRQAANALASRMEMLVLVLSFDAPQVYRFDGLEARKLDDAELPASVFNYSEQEVVDGGKHAHVRRGSMTNNPQIVSQSMSSKDSPRDLNEPIFLTEVAHALEKLEESKSLPLTVIGDENLVSEFMKRRAGKAAYKITNAQSHPKETDIAALCKELCRGEQRKWKADLIREIKEADHSSEQFCDNIAKALQEAERGRIARCMVAKDCDEWYRPDGQGGWVAADPRESEDAVEALDRIFIETLRKDGEATTLPQRLLPGNAKIAAVFKW